MKEYLKVKACILANEARIIKTLEQRTKERLAKRRAIIKEGNTKYEGKGLELMAENNARDSRAFWGLRRHRLTEVRREARRTYLAYGFIRGKNYVTMEVGCRLNNQLKKTDWEAIEAMALKYAEDDPRAVKQKFAGWMAEALLVLPIPDKFQAAILRKAAYHARPRRTRSEHLANQMS